MSKYARTSFAIMLLAVTNMIITLFFDPYEKGHGLIIPLATLFLLSLNYFLKVKFRSWSEVRRDD